MSKKKQQGTISLRTMVSLLALVLLLGCAIGGTIAWLTAQTDPVTNTFTVGDISIDLWENKYVASENKLISDRVTANIYKIVPGRDMPKSAMVTINKGTEPCWVFLKVEEKNFIDGLDYEIYNFWTPLPGVEGVYYKQYTPGVVDTYWDENGVSRTTKSVAVLWPAQITVDGNITKEDLAAIKDKEVSLTFKAYAIQYEGFSDVQSAWAELNKTYSITSTTPAE